MDNSKINLIDPNEVVSNLPDYLNGMPDVSAMHIFAELFVQRRGSTTISNFGAIGNSVTENLAGVKINLLGFDPKINLFTTRYTEAVDKENITPFEGFGMTQIKVTTNSSYIPIVEIDFIDIKGLSFFNLGKNSPYAALHSFPPPIFKLKIKGYFGRTLEYDLHLVRADSNFEAKTGNYKISVQFVARTFAPLTDILFKYADIFPLINKNGKTNEESLNIDNKKPPKNTHELILKGKRLYEDITKIKDTSGEVDAIEKSNVDIKRINEIIVAINNFSARNGSNTTKTDQNSIMAIVSNYETNLINARIVTEELGLSSSNFIQNEQENDAGDVFTEIFKVEEYNKTLRVLGVADPDPNLDLRLFLAIKSDPNTENEIINKLKNTKTRLIKASTEVVRGIRQKDVGRIRRDITDNNGIEYTGIDISNLYQKISKQKLEFKNKLNDNSEELKSKISDVFISRLGFQPTIKEIFKLLLNDVDVFFRKLAETSKKAEDHHNNEANDAAIRNHFGIKANLKEDKPIHPFPLYQKAKDGIGNLITQEEINAKAEQLGIPPDQAKYDEIIPQLTRVERAFIGNEIIEVSEPFPEVDFVEEFIRKFVNVVESDSVFIKNEEDETGQKKWLPITPEDSVLGNLDAESPYIGRVTPNQFWSEFLRRFTVSSQFTYSDSFYKNVDDSLFGFGIFGTKLSASELQKFIAKGEARNIVNSIVEADSKLLSMMITQAASLKNNVETLYNNPELNADSNTTLNFAPESITVNNIPLFANKTNPEYVGFEYLNKKPTPKQPKEPTSDATDIVDAFIENNKNLLDKVWELPSYFTGNENRANQFTKENILFLEDVDNGTSEDFNTSYLKLFEHLFLTEPRRNINAPRVGKNIGISLLKTISMMLRDHDEIILSALTGTNDDFVKAFFISSIFGYALSFFDDNVNRMFAIPGVVEVPTFSSHYMGGLVYFFGKTTISEIEIERLSGFIEFYNQDFFTSELGRANFPQEQYIIDSEDSVNTDAEKISSLSVKDKDSLEKQFIFFVNENNSDGYKFLEENLISLINEVRSLNLSPDDVREEYETGLQISSKSIITSLANNQYILNFSQTTFDTSDTIIDYQSLNDVNEDTTKKTINDNFFKVFFKELEVQLKVKLGKIVEREVRISEGIDDDDIKNQLYYSFKSINDKWIVGNTIVGNGFPLNSKDKPTLLDNFQFVDRAFNDIGQECIIDFSPLFEFEKDYDVSMFTVISRLLSHNGFEFFPLQNFMEFTKDDWEKTFEINNNVNIKGSPAFVCMYIGGTSSQLNDFGSDYLDDGFDLTGKVPPDFNIGSNSNDSLLNKVRAFRVRFGEQKQSIFSDIKLDTNEHKDTNESLQILSRLAQDDSKSVPVPKGQNLFNIYEQRSYTAKVRMLGNAMIQPTQYFQLENIPMFSGAYMILGVEHSIKSNFMETFFEGVRIARVPIPFVTEFSTSIGTKGAQSEQSEEDQESTEIVNFGDLKEPITNSMTELPISPPEGSL